MDKKTILIADDDRDHLILIALILRKEGYGVISAFDVKHAVQLAVEQDPDLLLLDIHMGAENGYAIQERLQKIEQMARTPVIYVTGDQSTSVQSATTRLGARAIIRKPFSRDELLTTVRAALGATENETLAATPQPS